MAEFNVDDLPDLNEAKLINVDDLPDLKKKGDTIKSGSGFSMLSGTESKSKSPEPSKPTQSQTKAINTNPTMPDFGLKLGFPIQKPTINLKTTEQEQRIIKSKESNQTPQVFEDYRSVIQKGIQGQNKMDATFQPLSKPIVEAQAKKEVQQLKEQQQATKLAKKETHQNILAVIPELSKAKNTDEAISAILKSDMKDNFDMWQQFDDNTLLSNDETTLNDFLVKKGLKNADREAYLKGQSESNPKYQYEYELNNISSLFGAVAQRAKDYEDVLKNKFGDNYLQQANAGNENILNDTEFNTFISLKEKEKSLSTKANSLINDPRFSSIKKELDKNEDKQLKSDAIAKADKWYNPTDELRYVGSKVLYAAGKAVKMLAELPSLATSIDKGYDWTDKLADWGDRFSTDLIDAIPVSTDLKAGFNNKVAKVGNYKVIIDDNGEVADVRDNNNFKVSLDEMKSVTDKYNANPKGYKVNNEYNPRSLADNGLNTVIDMGLMILGTKGAGVLGAGEKMQKLTSMGIAYQQTKRDVYNDAVKKGLDPRNADLLANIIGVAAGTSSSINPLEFNIASGKGLFNFTKTDGLNAGKLALIKEGKLSVKDYAKEFVKAGIKNTIGENIEELGIENTTQAIANNYFNSKISATDKTDGGLDDKLHIFDKQGLETFLITAGTSLLMTPIEMKSQMLGNQQEALKLAIDNPIDFKKIRQIQVEKGQLTQDEVDKEAKIYEDVSRTYNSAKEEIKEELRPQLLALLTKKYNLSNKIGEIKDDVLSAPYKAQLEEINKGIQEIVNGNKPSEVLVESVETPKVEDEVPVAENATAVNIRTEDTTGFPENTTETVVDKVTENPVPVIEETKDVAAETPAAEMDNTQLNETFETQIANPATSTQDDLEPLLNKFKKRNEQVQVTPTESIEQGQQNNDGTGLSETPKEEVEVVSGSGLKDVGLTGEQVKNKLQEIEKQPIKINITQDADGKIEQTSQEVIDNIKTELDKTGLPYEDVVSNDKGSTYYVVTKDGQQHEILRVLQSGGKLLPTNLTKAKWINHLIKTEKDTVVKVIVKAPPQYTEAATPKDDSAIQSGSEQVGQEVPTEKVEEKVDEILSTKKAEITPQKTIEIDRNVDSEDKAIKDNRGKKPNGYYIDVANLQEDGTADRVWEKAENAMPVKEYPTLDIFSHKKNGKVIISENNTGKKLVEADTIKEAKEKLKELIYKNGGELAFKDKLEKQSAQNSENNTNLVEDKAENEYINTKLTEQDNVEQEPSIKAIESQAESNDETELNEVVKKSDELINEAVGISRIPLSQLHTDESRFQAREKLNEQVVNDIANNFSDADQDPIHVWTDPKDGKTYVLSGHHRYYGAKKAGRTDVKIIDRTKDFTEKEAIKFATEDANANRSMETPLERANTLRKKRENGDSKEEINSFLEREGKNKTYTDNLSRLNPKGKAIQALQQLENSTDKVTQKETERIADWIGEARKSINGITDAHENEMFDFLMDKDTSKRITTKADFLQKVRSVVNPLMQDQPLNLNRFKNKTQGEQSYDEDVAEKKAEIAERQKQIDAINDRFTNPANPDYIRTNSADYEQARKIADEKISKLDAERKSLQKQLEDIYRNKGKYTSAATTGDLFGQDLVEDAIDRIANKIGSKKNLTEQERTSLSKDITDLAKGLIQMGKATIDNVIDKIKEEIKKRFPELDDKTVNEISENIEQKVILDAFVEKAKEKGLTYEQTKERLDKADADYNEQDLKDAWDGKEEPAGGNKKKLQNRAFDGTEDAELKSLIEDYGLTYETESQIVAESEANALIKDLGLDNAFKAVQNGYINGAQAAVVYAKMVDHIEAQLQKGNLSDEELVKLKELQAYTIDIFDNAARDAGRFIAMLKRVYHKSLFTYDAMVKSAENAKGTPLTEEERLIIKEQAEKIAELDKTIKDLEEKLEQERAKNAVQNIKAYNNKPKSVAFKARGKALADKIRGLKTKGLVLKDADGNPINIAQNSIVSYNEIIEIVAKTIEKTGEILDGIDTALNEIKKQDWYKKLSQRDKDAVDKQIKQDILDLDDDVSDDKFKIPHSLIREIVKNGTEDIDGIVKKVLEVYHDIYPDLDERKVRDIITKYGEQKKDTRDDIDKKISEAKRIGRHLSGKEDLLNGKPPKRSGFKRDKPTPTERLLMKEIQQLLKNIPKAQEEIDNLWTTALEKAKTRITNRIEELQLAIDKKERINKTKNVQNYNDTDLDKLKDDLEAKQKEYDDLFPKEKTELSDEQRLIQSVNAKKTQLKTLQSQKDSKVYERNKKDAPDRSKFPKLDKEIKDLDDKIKEIKEEIKQDDSWVKHIKKKRISLAIKANQRRIEEYRRRINEKDFVVVKNPTPISDELTKVRRERQKVADEYELAKYKYELENRTLGQKIFDGIFEGLQLSKQFVATADLSAPLRQGATVIFSNPIIWAKAFVDMHGQAFSHQTYKDSIDAIKNSKYYDLAQDSKLAITDADSINERKREEQFVSKLMDSNFMKKAPILAQYRQINKGSERAYSGFLNNIRFNLFEKGAKELEQAGYTFSDNPKMYKALATTINNLTGRGLSPSGNEGKFLNFVLFSPKMLTSRVLLMYDLLRTDIPLNSPSRKMAAKSLLGTITWVALFNVLGTMAANAFDDDDDDVLDGLNKNPIATDFAKVRDKQTTFDPTAGYAPLVRTLARIITEKSINASGKEKDLSKGYGQTRFSPFWDFMENKLSPIASYGLSLLTHKNPQNKFEDASKAEWNDYITPLFVPLQAMQLVENFNDKDSFGKDFIEVALGLYGIGVAQYDNTSKGNKNANSQTGNRRTERDNTARTTNRRTER